MSIPEFKFTGEQLSVENTGQLTGLIMNSDKQQELSKAEELMEEFSAQMIQKRLEVYGLKYRLTDFFLVASVLTFATNPGKLMIMLWLAHQYWRKSKKELLGIEEWCLIFPDGTPTEDELKVMWDSQKSEGNNMLDNPKNWD
jgi:hypothetical protein